MEPDGDDGLASCWRMVENVEGVDALLEDLKNHTFAKKDAFTVGEVFNIGVEDLPDFIGENGHFSTILISAPIYSVTGNTDGTMRHQFLLMRGKSNHRFPDAGTECRVRGKYH